jgi:hypothetical protein
MNIFQRYLHWGMPQWPGAKPPRTSIKKDVKKALRSYNYEFPGGIIYPESSISVQNIPGDNCSQGRSVNARVPFFSGDKGEPGGNHPPFFPDIMHHGVSEQITWDRTCVSPCPGILDNVA